MRRGFTLIELLVVVAIIGLLIAILLPTLSSAREQSREVVCLSNVKQIVQGFFMYAEEYRGYIPGTYWQGPINSEWSGRMNAEYLENPEAYSHPFEASVLRHHLSYQDDIFECPTGRREANTFFDYTVIIRMAGARTDLLWEMFYPTNPLTPSQTLIGRFPALPFLIEEDAFWYNGEVDDGSWANLDQFSDRHHGGCNIGYLDGGAGRFVSPKGGNREIQERADLKARQLRLLAKDEFYPVWQSNEREFGWVNDPR